MNAHSFHKGLAWIACAVAFSSLLVGCHHTGFHSGHAADKQNVEVFNRNNFEAEVLSSSQPVLVDFWAPWCPPCKLIAPAIAELATEFAGKAKVGTVDVDAEASLAKKYNIHSVPSLLIFKNGKIVKEIVGLRRKATLRTALDNLVGPGAPLETGRKLEAKESTGSRS